jgi:endonuclease/exonuclease/phosphatase family metal-dependent hydrolase
MSDAAASDTRRSSQGSTQDSTWRVMTWNVRGAARPDLTRIATIIGDQRPDVVALQEVRSRQATTVAGLLGWRHRWTRKHYPYTPALWRLAEGLAIVSPHHLDDPAHRTLSPGVSTWTYRHRVVLAATVRRDEASIRVYDVHLASGRRPDERITQASLVAALIAAERPGSAIVAGDFNAPGEVEVVRPFHAVGLRDPGGGPTHPSMAPRRRLDFILVPESARVTDEYQPHGGDEWRELSDHIPLVVEFHIA